MLIGPSFVPFSLTIPGWSSHLIRNSRRALTTRQPALSNLTPTLQTKEFKPREVKGLSQAWLWDRSYVGHGARHRPSEQVSVVGGGGGGGGGWEAKPGGVCAAPRPLGRGRARAAGSGTALPFALRAVFSQAFPFPWKVQKPRRTDTVPITLRILRFKKNQIPAFLKLSCNYDFSRIF